MVPAYLLSLLAKQRRDLQERFAEKFPHHWLVWEPGSWMAPKSGSETVRIDARNLSLLAQGDALSFGLAHGPGKPVTLQVGRQSTNDIVINDATVSRQHAVLKLQSPGTWTLEPLPSAKALTLVDSRALSPGQAVVLRSRTQVRLGEVTLTFYDLRHFMARLEAQKVS